MIESLKIQLQNSPLTHALKKGQWVYESSEQHYTSTSTANKNQQTTSSNLNNLYTEQIDDSTRIPLLSTSTLKYVNDDITKSTPILGTKNAFHNGQLLEWIKNLEKDIEPITKNSPTNIIPITTPTPSAGSSTSASTTTTKTTSTTTDTKNDTIIDNRIVLGILESPSATTASPSSSVISSESTDSPNDKVPKTLGELVASALAQSAAPLAGLSAATIAYGAAAMLPVWLPLALGKKKKKRRKKKRSVAAATVSSILFHPQKFSGHDDVDNNAEIDNAIHATSHDAFLSKYEN